MSATRTAVHDREVEAAMTGAFVFGRIGGVVSFMAAFIRGRVRGDVPDG